jgi:serpin B
MAMLLLLLVLSAPMIAGAAAQQEDIPELVAGNTAFAFDLYGELRQTTDGNLLFSPYSISEALAMTYAGAEGETATQMADVLGFILPEPTLHEAFGTLNADLVARGNAEQDPESGEPARTMRVANALWGEQTFPFNPEYIALVAQYYGGGFQQTDFINAPEPAREEINAWAAEQTENRIQDIFPPGSITEGTRLVLANAVYFYGGWEVPFNPNRTEDDAFFLLDGTTVNVPFMVQQQWLPYARGDGFQVIEFPYAESRFTFTVILPDEGQFDAVEAALDPVLLDSVLGQLADTDVVAYLPRFEFTFGSVSLKQPLESLGMTDAFDWERADFSAMIDAAARDTDRLCIDDGGHKAFISVDEKGTEAAAVTGIGGATPGAAPETEPLEVRIDRPFLFVIRDTQTGTLLFLGRVMDPSVEAESPEPSSVSHECSEGG